MTDTKQKTREGVYRFLRKTLAGTICRSLGYTPQMQSIGEGPCLILSNHNTDFDPVLLAASIKEHSYFVASEHVFRWGFVSKLLVWLFAPIARVKGMTDARAAMQILRKLKDGQNVCMFSEGNRSYNGVTGESFSATGKLARSSGARLVTWRFSGAYLTTPRWALTKRRGKIRGEIVNVYSPETLKAMSVDEINKAIAKDLYEDAFDRQLTENISYKGKRLAEGISYALFICPRCGKLESVYGEGDRVLCKHCGELAIYNDKGFFEGEKAPFETIRDWDKWQDERMEQIAEAAAGDRDKTVFSDEGQSLFVIDGHETKCVDKGSLKICFNSLSLGDTVIPLESIADLAVCGRGKLVFNVGNKQYDISSRPHCCGRKYSIFFQKCRKYR